MVPIGLLVWQAAGKRVSSTSDVVPPWLALEEEDICAFGRFTEGDVPLGFQGISFLQGGAE